MSMCGDYVQKHKNIFLFDLFMGKIVWENPVLDKNLEKMK